MSAGLQPSWEEIARSKRAALLAQIPQEWLIPPNIKPTDSQLDVTEWPQTSGWFTQKELEITSFGASQLLTRLKDGSESSEDVTRAFCKRAAAAHQLTNCLSEILFDSALARARELDDHASSSGKPVGPLHGLPISIKDNFNIVGVDTTVGFISWVNQPAAYNSTLIDLLLEMGAVLYCKTNVPTAMMIAETVNNTFGRTLNPLNRALTSGGSSGGESALILFQGSPLGVGTDIGGSLRIPAACTGIFTLRPSFGRFPTLRCRSGLAGQEAVQSVNGPMARTIEDLRLFSKTVVETQPWLHDPRCLPLPWRDTEVGLDKGEKRTGLRLAFMCEDGSVRPTPPVIRALRETVNKLRSAGHEVRDWDPKLHAPILRVLRAMFLADGGQSIRKILEPSGEPFRTEMKDYETATELGSYQMWQLHLERQDLQKAYLDQWNAFYPDNALDGILCPTTPYASVEHGNFQYVGFTGVFNILDYSCVSFPTKTVADKDLDKIEPTTPLSEVDKVIATLYNPENVHGMPVSLQIVARRLEEEKVLRMAEIIVDALR